MDRGAIRRLADKANRETCRKVDRLMRLSKTLKPGMVFKTGTGRVNKVLKADTRVSGDWSWWYR